MMRKMPQLKEFKPFLQTPWYCQYGDKRAKPTDIWSNVNWKSKRCKPNSQTCNHERAPRGSKTGTQGVKGAYNRSIVPKELCVDICNAIINNKGTLQTTLF